MRFFRTFGRLIVVVLLAALAGALFWIQSVGFGPGITARVSEGLSIGQIKVNIGRLTFNPFTGFIAEDSFVTVPMVSGAVVEVTVRRIEIAPNLAALVSGKFLADTLRVEGGSLQLPFADDGQLPDSVHVEIEEAEIQQTQKELRINAARLSVEGIHLDLKATLWNLESLKRSSSDEGPNLEARAQTIRAVLAVLDEIKFKQGRPSIAIEVSGDLADLDSLEVSRIQAKVGALQYREVALNGIILDAYYKAQEIVVKKVELTGSNTELRLTGQWDTMQSEGDFELAGNLEPSAILASLGKPEISEEVRFLGGAEISATVHARSTVTGPDIRATGRLESGAFQLKKIGAKSFSADFAWNNGKFYSSDANLVLQSGHITADVLSAPQDFRLRLKSDAVPTELLPIMGKYERAVVEVMEFKDAPELEVTITGDRPHMDALSGRGKVRLGRTAMRGAWIDSATADIVIADRAAIYENILLTMGGQKATGAFTYDFGRREVRLGNIKSNVMPAPILMWVDPRIAATVAVYKFVTPPYVEADGLVHMENPDKNALRIKVDARGGLDYELIGKELRFGATKGTVDLLGQKVYADIPQSSLYGGRVSVKAEISTNPKNPTLSAGVDLHRVDFTSVTQRYFGYEKSKGVMSGQYQFTSMLQDDGSMRGSGSIRVEDGHVLAIPVFGPLSEIISTIIPGAGHESARLATADFEIAERTITSSNLEIEGNGFTLFGSGDVRYPSGDMDMSVRINARGIPGIVLFPVSKLLEYVSTGTVSDPQWRPKIVPREFFEILGMSGNNTGNGATDSNSLSKPNAPTRQQRPKVLKPR